MQTANAWVETNDLHDNVNMRELTPAEALIVRKQFGIKVAGQSKPTNPITHMKINSTDINRSKDDEFTRLTRKYGEKLVTQVFPGENPNIPMTFKEIGFEESDVATPPAGKPMEVVPLSKLSRADTSDEQSVKELAMIEVQKQEIEKLKAQLAAVPATSTIVPLESGAIEN